MGLFNRFSSTPIPKSKGKLIVIDGPQGTGKATQTTMLANTMTTSNYDGVLMEFPQMGIISEPLIEKYRSGSYGELDAEAASIFFAIDRLDAAQEMREYLSAGKIILSHRYTTSNAGEQGARIAEHADRVKFYKWLDHLEYTTFKIPRPDVNIILHIPGELAWETAKERLMKEGKAGELHLANREYFLATEQAYQEIALLYPNTKLVECHQNGKVLSPSEIHTKVWELVRRIALKDMPNHPR